VPERPAWRFAHAVPGHLDLPIMNQKDETGMISTLRTNKESCEPYIQLDS
jgi:hypothetical protein